MACVALANTIIIIIDGAVKSGEAEIFTVTPGMPWPPTAGSGDMLPRKIWKFRLSEPGMHSGSCFWNQL